MPPDSTHGTCSSYLVQWLKCWFQINERFGFIIAPNICNMKLFICIAEQFACIIDHIHDINSILLHYCYCLLSWLLKALLIFQDIKLYRLIITFCKYISNISAGQMIRYDTCVTVFFIQRYHVYDVSLWYIHYDWWREHYDR